MRGFHRLRRLAAVAFLAVLATATGLPWAGGQAAPLAAVEDVPRQELSGWEVYRRLDRLSELPLGEQTRQFSSFDRSGGNDDGVPGTWSCLRRSDFGCVLAEHGGAGEIASIWFTRGRRDPSTGNPRPEEVAATGRLRITLDGRTVVDAAAQDVVTGRLGPPFVPPLVLDLSHSSGGASVKVPMPFRESMLVETEQNPTYYHVTFRAFADPASVSPFDPSDAAPDVVDLLRRAGTRDPKPARDGATTTTTPFAARAGESVPLARVAGPGMLTAVRIKLPQIVGPVRDPDDPRSTQPEYERAVADSDAVLRDARIRISFDGRRTVDAPVGEFFGSGLGEYPVAALLFALDPDGWYSSWWPMPYRQSASVELFNGSGVDIGAAEAQVISVPDAAWETALRSGRAGYFHTTSNRAVTVPTRDWMFLEASGHGRFVGVSHTMESHVEGRQYLEGDERAYVDDARTPALYGTGTEDFYEAGWYFSEGSFSNFANGATAHEVERYGCRFECDAGYRLLLSEALTFNSSSRFGIEHGGTDEWPATYSSTAFWYGDEGGRMQRSDVLQLGDARSEAEHGYRETEPGETARVTSVFEGDDDDVQVTADTRSTRGRVAFRLKVDERNRGVTLRRVGDQRLAYQAAVVVVDGQRVGLWSQPLGNPVQRWLEDGFLLPARVTAGRRELNIELVPVAGAPPWNASRYEAFWLTGERE